MDLLKAICIALNDARYPSDKFSFKVTPEVFNNLKFEFKDDINYSIDKEFKTIEFKMMGYLITVTPED